MTHDLDPGVIIFVTFLLLKIDTCSKQKLFRIIFITFLLLKIEKHIFSKSYSELTLKLKSNKKFYTHICVWVMTMTQGSFSITFLLLKIEKHIFSKSC